MMTDCANKPGIFYPIVLLEEKYNAAKIEEQKARMSPNTMFY